MEDYDFEELLNGAESPYQTMAAFAIAHKYMLNPSKQEIKACTHLALDPNNLITSRVPDVVFYTSNRHDNYTPMVIIEIEQKRTVADAKITEIIETYQENNVPVPPVKEYFIYELEINEKGIKGNRWYKYNIDKKNIIIQADESYSEVLEIDLSKLFDPKDII